MKLSAVIGNKGEKIRSDCEINLQLTDVDGIRIDLESKVDQLYGRAIRELITALLRSFGIVHADVAVRDSGALEFVLAARMEAAVQKIKPSGQIYLLPKHARWKRISDPGRSRITRLYLPGNTPSLMLNAGIHRPDGVILDLEDSVSPPRKHEARFLVRNVLRNLDFMGAERMVRINPLPEGRKDLEAILPGEPDLLLLPKTESSSTVMEIVRFLESDEPDPEHPILLMPIIESALGIERAFEIAGTHPRVVAMSIGLEDYTADLGVPRTETGMESAWARSRMVNACRAAGIQAIDSVYPDVDNEGGLKAFARESRALGFEGMGCIHPRQIPVSRKAYLPTPEEIDQARQIVSAFEAAGQAGSGVVSLGSRMIDPPVVRRAQQIIRLADEESLSEKAERHD